MIVVDDKGVRASSLAANLQDVQARFRATFGEDLSLSPQTPQAQIAGILAFLLTEVGEAIVEDGMNSDVEHAGGTVLDQLMGLLDVRRIVATYSRVTATLTGVAGTGVPAGSRAKTTDGDVFQTLQAVVLSPSGVTVEMRAVEEGPVEAAAGALTQIVTVVAGWETITNANPAVLGVARQSDASARQQYVIRTAHSSIGPMTCPRSGLVRSRSGKGEGGGKQHGYGRGRTGMANRPTFRLGDCGEWIRCGRAAGRGESPQHGRGHGGGDPWGLPEQ